MKLVTKVIDFPLPFGPFGKMISSTPLSKENRPATSEAAGRLFLCRFRNVQNGLLPFILLPS